MAKSDIRVGPWMFIAWAPYARRSESLAREVGAELCLVHYLKFQNPFYAPVKYVLQSIRTLMVLFSKRPAVVFVQNPPFVCGLVVYLYCCTSGAHFVFDHHSAVFSSVWDWALPIQKFLAQRAITNIVTNQHWADSIRSWGASALIMGDPFLELPQGEMFPVEPGFNVAFVSTFSPDEPLDAVLEAAAQLPEVHFYITGDSKRQPKSFFDSLPTNVTCTGFLPDAHYVGLLRAVDAMIALTTRDHTLQLGGCEAVSLAKPLITSDWPYLRKFFVRGTIHVASSADGIREGIRVMQEKYKDLKEEMIAFRQESRQEWNAQLAQLERMIADQVAC